VCFFVSVSSNGANNRFFQVERLSDYAPANRQVDPTPVPTDYSQQLTSLWTNSSNYYSQLTSLSANSSIYNSKLTTLWTNSSNYFSQLISLSLNSSNYFSHLSSLTSDVGAHSTFLANVAQSPFYAYRTGAQTGSNGWNKLLLNTEMFGRSPWWNNALGKYLPTVAGYYSFQWAIYVSEQVRRCIAQ
jgi:hypothetical protein